RDAQSELYSAPIEGGARVRLDTLPGAGGNVDGFSISSDSKRVVYRADRDDHVFELYSVPTGGGAAVKLNGELGDEGTVWLYLITGDSSRVVYRAQQAPDYRLMLYSAPIAGGAATQLSPAAGSPVRSFALSKSGDTVVYSTYASQLHSVPAAGGASVKLDADGVVYWFTIVPGYQISADGRRVIHVRGAGSGTAHNLYSAPIDGGPATMLSDPTDGANVTTIMLPADGATALYWVTWDGVAERDLYAAPLAGGPARRISRPGTAGGWAAATGDGSRIVYIERQPDGRNDLLAAFEGGAIHLPLLAR
ncbi:MAG TPA: hypothetical protein VGE07_04750, partial [Herpetosiphonaceae bacterium]